MGDEADQEMLDACDSELQIKQGLPLSNPANGELRNGDAPAAANKETLPEIVISVDQTQGLPCRYNIQDGSSFTRFIEGLRNLLAEHPEPEHLYDRHPNLSSSKKHPLLAKPRGDQQPERRIEVKLQVSGQGKGATSSSSTTLVIRDDNVDVMGFSNHRGVWYELGNNRCLLLPPWYNNSELLPASWVINKEQVANMLVESSTCLGKTFAADAVRVLSCFPDVADGDNPRLALVGLSIMVCDSARMNSVLKTIAEGWNSGTRFTEQLMTDTVGKYEWMPRSLWQWSTRNYAKPHPAESDLQAAVRLVLNGPPEVVYTIGDELSFISFMIDLRRMITDHPVCKDILDEHKDRNLSSTHEHPLLPRQHARHPERWLHVKLQVVEGEETMSWTTTLLMRDDNLYVHGFMNKQGVVYGLVDKNKDSAMVLPDPYLNRRVKELKWSVQYITMLKAASNDDMMTKLAGAHLGRTFAMKAVAVLSRYPDVADGDNPRLALAGLIFMICESARMNPLHNAFARGWSTGTGFTEELMKRYVWNYSDKSRKLRKWKDKRYAESGELPHPIKELQDVYLVLNTTSTPSGSTTKAAGDGGSSRGSGGGPNQSGEAGDNAGSNTGSASQQGKAGDAGTSGGSAFQPGDAGHGGPSRGNNCSQPQDAYNDARDNGRPMVELLAIHADHLVVGTKIIVYDGIRGQIIYRKEKQGKHNEHKEQRQQGMVELVLTGPYTCISAEGCFAIQIEIPDDDAGSSTKDDSGPIEWEWDCYDPKYAAEVDKPPVTQLISDSVPSRKVAEVTYAVMSNAREATVQVVKFRLKDGQIAAGIGGEITALIDGFEDKYRSVLFWCAKGTRRYFSRTGDDDPWFLLELARNVVAVPCGRVLHILVDLQVVTDDGKEVEVEVALCFDNGIWSKVTDDGKEVEVEVTWYPEIARSSKPPEQRISKEDDEEKFITALSEKSGPPELLKDKLIKEGSNSSSNISGPSMDCYPQSRPVTQQSEGAVYNRKLYMHQIFDGLDYNQVNIADLGQPHMFGCTNVHDYPIYDSLDPNAKIVARAQGLHTETCLDYDNWFHWSRLVFSDERFEGSSFMAIGDQNKVTGEWAIVGGTGVFAFAQGTITICRAEDSGSSNIKEICIHALGFTGQATPIETPQNIKSFKDNMLNVDSKATSNACSPSMASPHSGPLTPQSQATEYIRTWYMHQIITGPDYNQVPIANPEKPEMFGYTYVHDYPIYDSLGPGKKIVARAQGLHSKTSMNNGGSWLHWSKVVFDYERFQGSSFNAIGNQEGEWAIVGGTGEFAFVQGTVTTRRVRESWPSNIKEIRIHAFCHPLTTPVETNNKIFEDGMIIIGSNAVSNVSSPMANTNPQSATVTPLSMRKYNRILYMHQIISGPDYNQVNIANPEQPEMFAYTNVHDYPIYDSLGPSKKLVARAQGLHTKTSMSYNGWFHWSSIVFTDERFQGSSLKTIGNQEGDWAIMGGTGAFTFAQGTVTTCRIQDTGFSNIKEIRIDALCCTPVNGVLP